jgi:hypothetical protein
MIAIGREVGLVALYVACCVGLCVAGCRGRGALDEAIDALKDCDYGDACTRAAAAVRTLDPDAKESRSGLEARSSVLHAAMQAAAAFPMPREPFLKAIGLDSPDVASALGREAVALAGGQKPVPGAADAAEVAAFLRVPACEAMVRLGDIARAGGPFADTAVLARVTALAQVFAAIEPDRAGQFADMARETMGCTVSERTGSDALLLEARNTVYDLLGECAASKDAVSRASCDSARQVLDTRPLPLPFPDASSGDLFGAIVPPARRGLGLVTSPPWAAVLAAGRLSIVDQVSLLPGAKQLAQPDPEFLIDLRRHHRTEDVATSFHLSFETRKPGGSPTPIAALVVDRAATCADLLEVLEAHMSESDAVTVLAVMGEGARRPAWLPLNYRLPSRILLDPSGSVVAFGDEADAVRIHLSPIEVRFEAGTTERTVPISRTAVDASTPWDLREAYAAAIELAGGSPAGRSALLTADPAVPVGLLVAVIESISVRVAEGTRHSASSFATALPLRVKGGAISWLFRKVVLMRPE